MPSATVHDTREADAGTRAVPLSVAGFVLRFLTFQLSRDRFAELSRRHLVLGLVGTWLVGMGRYWDDPEANWAQHLGVGSLVYVVLLSLLLWAIFVPLQAEGWTFTNALTLVSLTSFPAAIYAVPVEKFLSSEAAAGTNVVFLLVVATWRVLLLLFFLRRFAMLTWPRTLAGTAFPLFSALTVLAVQRLLGEVVNIMGGVRQRPAFSFGDLAVPFAVATLVAFVAYIILITINPRR